ncbi:AmpG family muropeptide MFS transporter [Paraglaciecola chathamensis]|jgi:PAT family beta-lactamase induction signal transducer AmpG|uniref:MFS transporter, PAT family, beta-lactamase induction signal transducer AmpG n=1 Tax=Paraglaciecola chathamensis S18K6 TaxID=1127672 RepID=A0AAV3UVA3_9ALTE|nr:AmpG family muropeptide MFS transporter [Paraglaciecola chathamensis]GAC08850.1 MFS transporter, PAT family, beta-lactamase induction signal transducer AmpG [Paraglaciecola chathamensis S18K6]
MNNKTLRQALLNKRMLICICTGFSSGLPLYLLIQFVPAWLRSADIDLSTIGLINLVLFPYTWKFIWSPVMDRFVVPVLGRRRGWMFITQIALIVLMSMLSFYDPATDISHIIVIVAAIAFFSASQDIVIDAYRRELLPDDELGAGNGFYAQAYRISSFVPGSLAMILAGFYPWSVAHLSIAAFMLVGLVTTLMIKETSKAGEEPQTLRSAVVEPFVEFFQRQGWQQAVLILLFIMFYKLGDSMATALETPFFLDMGFSTVEIGSIAKIAKTIGATAGTILGGIAMIKLGINRSLWVFGVFQLISILGYVMLSMVGYNHLVLAIASGFEYFGVGLGSVALIAFMAKSTNRHFTATQFALFSSIAAVPRTFVSATTGYVIEAVGYTQFFLICFVCAIPGMLMLLKIAPWNEKKVDDAQP